MPRPRKQLRLSQADRSELERIVRSPSTRQSIATRARIILEIADGASAQEVIDSLGVSGPLVTRWRQRFESAGVAGLHDLPRSGQPRKITPEVAKKILDLTVHQVPHEATHWSLRLMARYADVTIWQVRQVWIAAGLKPHRLQTFKISNDPRFAEKVCDVVGLYMSPPDNAVVLSVDEKTQIQALDRTQPMLQLKPGQIERRTHDYKRNGTLSLYAAFNILTGEVMGRVTRRHRAREFLAFLRQIERAVEPHLDVHLILDNSSTHSTPEVKRWLERHPRFVLHFTPTSASWLNAVEGWFSQLERRALYRGVFTNVTELREELHRFIRVHNQKNAKPFRWTKGAQAIIAAVDRARAAMKNQA